jgi:hypothetical protein
MKTQVPHTYHNRNSFASFACVADEKNQIYMVDSKDKGYIMDVWSMHMVVAYKCSTMYTLLFHHCIDDMPSSYEVDIVS